MIETIIAFTITVWAGMFAYGSFQLVKAKRKRRMYRDQVIELIDNKFVLKNKK